jgi:phage head maturation protease
MTTSLMARRAAEAHRAERPPTDRIMRVSPFAVRAADDPDAVNDGLTLDGYAAVFRAETLIDSWEGRFWEQLLPGSMRKSLREQTPRLQFDHGTNPTIGSVPIGKVTRAAEEVDPELAPEGGAHIVARLFDNWLVQPVRDAIAGEAIDGMSFRFGVVREEWYDPDGKRLRDEEEIRESLFRSWYQDLPEEELLHRHLREVKVPEAGPVVWPAYEQTSVGVRSSGKVTIDLGRLRTDPNERRKLAEAMFLADEATGTRDDEKSHPTVEGEGMVGDAQQDAPGTTPEGAEDHPSEQEHDAPGTTPEGAGDHPSTEEQSTQQRGMRPIDLAVRQAREALILAHQTNS